MKKKFAIIILSIMLFGVLAFSLSACSNANWKKKFDTSLPNLSDENWTNTMDIDFSTIKNMQQLYAANWAPSPHGLRDTEFWCDQMVTFSDKGVVIKSEKQTNHQCDICKTSNGTFTSGIETRPVVRQNANGEDINVGFTQAFGYYEATVIVPRGSGMWSAFWLQSDACGKIGHGGKDGCEIDVYESSFGQNNPTSTGQALHYDAYKSPWYKTKSNVTKMPYNLYDGKPHKYALLWTPEKYVMYVDDTPVWATDCGGVSRTPEFLRLTVEIRDKGLGPYGQHIGKFENHQDDTNDFVIQSVKVYQNAQFESEIKSIDDFKDMKSTYIAVICIACLAGAAIIAIVTILVIKKVKNSKN